MSKKTIIAGVGVGAVALGGVALLNRTDNAITLENPQEIVWVKPTTDIGWARDVQIESLDIRRDATLTKMIATHTAKLAKEEEAYIKYQTCPQCVRFEWWERLRGSGMRGQALEDEADAQAAQDIRQRLWSIEKLKQSIERMDKELDLRARSAVTRNPRD